MVTTLTDKVHHAMHRIPGVPVHATAPTTHAQRATNRRPRNKNRTHHHDSPPRVFVAWQNWIAAQVSKGR